MLTEYKRPVQQSDFLCWGSYYPLCYFLEGKNLLLCLRIHRSWTHCFTVVCLSVYLHVCLSVHVCLSKTSPLNLIFPNTFENCLLRGICISQTYLVAAFVEDNAIMSLIQYFENHVHVSYFLQNRRKRTLLNSMYL